jgi:hypothetical protein
VSAIPEPLWRPHPHRGSDLERGSIASAQLADGTIATADIADDAITAAKLDPAIPLGVLGYAARTSDEGSITTEEDLNDLSVTVTVAASRRIRITGSTLPESTVADDAVRLFIKEGSTTLQSRDVAFSASNAPSELSATVILSPSTGSHTYKLTMKRESGSGDVTNNASSDGPSYILVEDIGSA